MTGLTGALVAACCLVAAGCAVPKQMLAAPADLTDYRSFRLASAEGTRLARAQTYLDRHPHGAWADEVRGLFEAEESAWFEAAKSSRARAREYVVDLPEGPHADAARALLQVFDAQEQDISMLELLADARRTSAALDVEEMQRHQVNDLILEELAAIIDPKLCGADPKALPGPVARILGAHARSTWGPPPPPRTADRADDVYFLLRTPGQVQGRVIQLRFGIRVGQGHVVAGTIAAEDLFVRWAEASQLRLFDAGAAADRGAAAAFVQEVLSGALEARLPQSRCAVQPGAGEVFVRACDGWRVTAKMGKRSGAADSLVVYVPARCHP